MKNKIRPGVTRVQFRGKSNKYNHRAPGILGQVKIETDPAKLTALLATANGYKNISADTLNKIKRYVPEVEPVTSEQVV